MPIGPQVLILGTSGHGGTGLSCAEFGQDAVEHVNLVVELDCVHGEPFVQVLSSRQLDGQLHVAAAEGHASNLLELVAASALLDFLLLLETLRLVKARQRLRFYLFAFH